LKPSSRETSSDNEFFILLLLELLHGSCQESCRIYHTASRGAVAVTAQWNRKPSFDHLIGARNHRLGHDVPARRGVRRPRKPL